MHCELELLSSLLSLLIEIVEWILAKEHQIFLYSIFFLFLMSIRPHMTVMCSETSTVTS